MSDPACWCGPSRTPYADAVEAAALALAEASPAGRCLAAALDAIFHGDPDARRRFDRHLERAFAGAADLDDAWRAREGGR